MTAAKKKTPASEEVKAAKVDEPAPVVEDAPEASDGIERDPASGAIITGEDEHGNALDTDAVAGGAAVHPYAPIERADVGTE